MANVAAQVTFVSSERKDTRNGKERYVARSADGREFSIWDANLHSAVLGHLHEDLVCEVSSRQDDRGNWWNTLHGLPALGVAAVDTRGQNGGGAPSGGNAGAGGVSVDLAVLTPYLERIALVLENIQTFIVASALGTTGAPADEPQNVSGPGPDWPNDK